MNERWGWVPEDEDWKSARDLVHALCETVGQGREPAAQRRAPGRRLARARARPSGSSASARWMARYGEAVARTSRPASSRGSGTARRPGATAGST